jgi:hypothetical protein
MKVELGNLFKIANKMIEHLLFIIPLASYRKYASYGNVTS